jgi:hypothetical protein
MPETELHKPVGKDGEGLYTASTKGCFDVINKATATVLQMVETANLVEGSPYVVADFGTADAGTSLGLMCLIVDKLREVAPGKEVSINYEDQLQNEWKSVFNHAFGKISVTDAYGNALGAPASKEGVFINACGLGFHSQCYPSGSLDLALSFTAMHWLSAAPNSLVGQEAIHAARCKGDEAAAEQAQAAADWISIMTSRAAELKTGGKMVIVNFCVSEEGHYLGNTEVGVSMWDSFDLAWAKLRADGHIDDTELKAISFPSYYRTKQEMCDGVNSVPGLKVVACEEHVVRCPYRQHWTEGKEPKRSAEEHAAWFVPTTKTWSNSTFKAALHADRDDKDEVIEMFWANYVALVAEKPDEHGMDYVHCYLAIEKE